MKKEYLLSYKSFANILNETVFGKSKLDLLKKIASNPNRFIGIFRPTKPKGKILQNLLQSHEIRFGNAIETMITEYLKLNGAELLPNKYDLLDGSYIDVDLCFRYKNIIYVVELKIRDDHDSTKIRGQAQNFELKIDTLLSIHKKEKSICGVFFCIDPGLVKNMAFYKKYFDKIKEKLGVNVEMCYGKDFFSLLKIENIWDEICEYLVKWKEEIPDLPEVNFDTDAEQSFNEIKDLPPSIFIKLFENDQLYNEIILTLFPQKKTLHLLKNYFKELAIDQTRYNTLFNILKNKL